MSSYLIFVMRCCCWKRKKWTRVWGLLLIFLVWCLYDFFFSSSLRDAGGWIYFLWGFLISFLTLKLLNCFCYYAFFRAVAAAYTNLFSYSPFIFRFKKNSIILNSTRLSNFLMIRKEHFKETIFFDKHEKVLLNHQKVMKKFHQFLNSTHVVFIKFFK